MSRHLRLGLIVALYACGGGAGGTTPVLVTRIDVSPSAIQLRLGTAQATAQLLATPRTSSGAAIVRPVVWETDDAAVATVSTSGLVTATGVGTTRVKAVLDGVEGSATVAVTIPAVASVSVSLGITDLLVGETTTASAVLRDADGNTLAGRVITWASTNPGVAAVTQGGIVTAVAEGTTSIIATSEGVQGPATLQVSGTAPNLTVTGVLLTQSVQRADGGIPLVAEGNPVLVNVYGTLDRPYGPGRPAPTMRIVLSGAGPNVVDERPLTRAIDAATSLDDPIHQVVFNGSVVQPGLRIGVTINPTGALPEADASDNAWPASGQAHDVAVRVVPSLDVHFVPVLLNNGGTVGRVDEIVMPEYLFATRQMHPISSVNATIGATMATDVDFGEGDASAFTQILQQLDVRRVVEGTARYYVGSIRPPPGVTFVQFGGYAYIPPDPASSANNTRTATVVGVGWFNRARHTTELVAHELAHTMGRRHAPCGGAAGPDPQYPHPNAIIGAYGHDLYSWSLAPAGAPAALLPSQASDIMSYCTPAWVSDYTYQALLDARTGAVAVQNGAMATEPCECLIVWGSVEGDSIRLQPAFTVKTRAVPPTQGGSFRIEAEREDGSRIFSHAFEPAEIDHAPGTRHFTLAIPLPAGDANAIATIRAVGPMRAAERRWSGESATAAVRDAGMTLTRGAPGASMLQWDPRRSAAMLVRDATTGEVLALGMRGQLRFPAGRGELEVLLTDGVRTTTRRIPAQR